MAKKPAAPARRKRTTTIQVVIPATIKALADILGVHPSTLAARYHRIKDAHPRAVPTLQALVDSHKGGAYRGKFKR